MNLAPNLPGDLLPAGGDWAQRVQGWPCPPEALQGLHPDQDRGASGPSEGVAGVPLGRLPSDGPAHSLCSYMELKRDMPINTGFADDEVSGLSGMHKRLERLGKAKERGQEMGRFLLSRADLETSKVVRLGWQKYGQQVHDCGTYMVFRHYLAQDVVKLARVHTCKKHLLCPVCAILRAGKSLRRYVESIAAQVEAGAVPYMVTHTVKNSEELRERADHLLRSYRKMLHFRRTFASKGRGDGWQLSGVEGGLYSLEVKRGAAGGWHPHVHALWLLPPGKRLDVDDLRELWLKVTKDSHVFNVKPIIDQGDGIASACLEVLKYALKFSDMTLADNWFAATELRRLRLTASFGSLRGIKEEEAGPDELEEGDEPFVEYVARWIGYRYLIDPPK